MTQKVDSIDKFLELKSKEIEQRLLKLGLGNPKDEEDDGESPLYSHYFAAVVVDKYLRVFSRVIFILFMIFMFILIVFIMYKNNWFSP